MSRGQSLVCLGGCHMVAGAAGLAGVAIIVASIVLTGVYVSRANSHYDELTKAIVNAAAMGGK